jgi:hypothetical protein
VVIQLVGRIRGVNFNQISAICLLNSKTEKEQQLNGRYSLLEVVIGGCCKIKSITLEASTLTITLHRSSK